MVTQYVFQALDQGNSSFWDGELSWSSTLATAYAMDAELASIEFNAALSQGPFVLVRILSVI